MFLCKGRVFSMFLGGMLCFCVKDVFLVLFVLELLCFS